MFDIDETLIKSFPEIGACRHREIKERNPHIQSSEVKDPTTGESCVYLLKLRPFLHDLLENLIQHFDLFVFSMGSKAYVQEILSLIDPESRYFLASFSREDAVLNLTAGKRMKDLKRVLKDRNLSKTIIIDNIPDGIVQLANLIPIPNFEGNDND